MTDEPKSVVSDAPLVAEVEQVSFNQYDRRSLSYASTFEDPWKSRMISVK